MGISASKLRLNCFGKHRRHKTPRSTSAVTNTLSNISSQHTSSEKPTIASDTTVRASESTDTSSSIGTPMAKAKPKAKALPKPELLEAEIVLQNDPLDDEESGPVSSRTRHGGKKKPTNEAAPSGFFLSQSNFPPVSASNFSMPDTDMFGAFDTLPMEVEEMDAANEIFSFGDPINPTTLDTGDLWDMVPPVTKKKKKTTKKGHAHGPSTVVKPPEPPRDHLERKGDEALAQLVLPDTPLSYSSTNHSNSTSKTAITRLKKTPEEQGDIQRFVRKQTAELHCKCGKSLFPNAVSVMRLARSWMSPKASTYLAVCQHCDTSTCMVCRTTGIAARHKCGANKAYTSLFIMWILLCGLDECVRPGELNEPKRANSSKRKRTTLKPSKTAWASGTGYGGSGGDGWGASSSDSLDGSIFEGELDDQERSLNKVVTELSKRIPELLNLQEAVPLFLQMLQRSHMLRALSSYLENDSLHTVTKDTAFYVTLLKIVSTLLTNVQTRNLVMSQHNASPANGDLLHYTYSNPAGVQLEDLSVSDIGQPRTDLASSLRKLSGSCALFEANVDRNAKAASDKGAKEVLQVCKLVKDIVAQLDGDSDQENIESEGTDTSLASCEEEWFRNKCLLDVPDGSINDPGSHRYYFSTSVRRTGKPNPGRMKHLLAEIVTLKTSLPPGIFVRHEMSRLDIIKVLIIGPQGTPYQNGAFEFDFYCPETYPNSPPMVQFKQTGSGTESMNPNLYPDGKVCLSLLGTWQGEPWRPGKSTLLQVLLSLQGMVFCDEPYYNEPGWSSYKNDSQSNSYNRNLYRATTQVAILQWLDAMEERQKGKNKATAKGDDLWDEVLLRHFSKNADSIMRTLKEWEADIAVGKKEVEEAQKAAAAAQKAAMGGNVPPGFPTSPPPMPNVWSHYANGKSSLEAMIPRVETALKKTVQRATDNGVLDPPTTSTSTTSLTSSEVQQAIKSPAELLKRDNGDEMDDTNVEGSAAKRTRSKRRKTGNEA